MERKGVRVPERCWHEIRDAPFLYQREQITAPGVAIRFCCMTAFYHQGGTLLAGPLARNGPALTRAWGLVLEGNVRALILVDRSIALCTTDFSPNRRSR
jgi:hypothetical protein